MRQSLTHESVHYSLNRVAVQLMSMCCVVFCIHVILGIGLGVAKDACNVLGVDTQNTSASNDVYHVLVVDMIPGLIFGCRPKNNTRRK